MSPQKEEQFDAIMLAHDPAVMQCCMNSRILCLLLLEMSALVLQMRWRMREHFAAKAACHPLAFTAAAGRGGGAVHWSGYSDSFLFLLPFFARACSAINHKSSVVRCRSTWTGLFT